MKSISVLQWGLFLTPVLATPSKRSGTCNFFYTADDSDTCLSMASTWDITVDQFLSYNPSVKDCDKLTAGAQYCVEWKGDPPTEPSTTPKTTTTSPGTTSPGTTTPTTTKSPGTTSTTTTTGSEHSPTQPGIISSCTDWYLVQKDDSCWKIATDHNLSTDQFIQWNPSVGATCGTLFSGYYVCVGAPGASVTTSKPPTTTQPSIPIQPGTPANCKKYYLVQSGDGCWSIETSLSISDSDFRKWNPGLNDGCTNLFAGYNVCVQP